MITPFKFQENARDAIVSRVVDYILNIDTMDRISFLVVAPTGGGKTVISGLSFVELLRQYPEMKILAVMNLQSLVSQTYETLVELGIDARVLHNDLKTDRNGKPFNTGFDGQVLITMPETYCNILAGKSVIEYEDINPAVIWLDEAHKATSENNQIIKDKYPRAAIMGTTASPYRPNNKEGEHLYTWYGDNLIITSTVRELIDLGRLVQPYYYSYNEDDHIVKSWQEMVKREKDRNKATIVFTQNTDQSIKLCKAFNDSKITAEIITAGSDVNPNQKVDPQTPEERNEIYKRFRTGKTKVLISVNALCEGWDEPIAKFCIIARRVGNRALYQQMVGRVIRSYKNKTHAVVMDFGGNYETYGAIEDIVWTIEDDTDRTRIMHTDGKKPISQETLDKRTKVFFTCESCHHVYDLKKSRNCPICSKESGVVITDSLGTRLNSLLTNPIKDNTHLRNILSSILGAKNYKGTEADIFRIRLGNRLGADIFDDDGNFTEEFKFIEPYLRDVKKAKMNSTIEV